jgi:phenylacetate-CoA ligase
VLWAGVVMTLGAVRKLHGSVVVLGTIAGQRRLPFRPAEEWQTLRDNRLRSIVRYAARTVPHYHDLFRRLDIDPEEIRTVEDLGRLPLLTKAEVRVDPDRFVSDSRLGRNSLAFTTSGTTGEPLRIHHDPRSLLENTAYGERSRALIQQACGKRWGYRVATIAYSISPGHRVTQFNRRRTLLGSPARRLSIDIREPAEAIVTAINHFRPHVIGGFGGYLEELHRLVDAQGLEMHRPRLLRVFGEGMSNSGREFIEGRFGTPVYSSYSAMESFKIGFTCHEGSGYHLHADLCDVKLIDSSGGRVADGEPGEVVISNLVNRGSVLLNYRLGDIAVRLRKPCPCGRTLPLLSELEGRVEDILHLPDGRLVHPRLVWQVFKPRPEVLRYQLEEYEPARFELRLKLTDQAAGERLLAEVQAELLDLLGEVELKGVVVHDRDLAGGGKFRTVISHRSAPRGAGPQAAGSLEEPA